MAKPFSASRLIEILRAEGLEVHEYRDWRDHNRNHTGAWGPINGVMIHHTVTSGTEGSVRLCYEGYSGLPGPLCHGVIAKDGSVYLVGNGRANHAGLGDDNVLQAVIDERDLPADNEANTDGNARYYGFECINMGDGDDPWPDAQLDAIEKVAAAICRAYDWNERSVLGHLEWQPGKIDPRGFSMDWMRERVAQRIGNPPNRQGGNTGEDDMPQLVNLGETEWETLHPGSWNATEFHTEWDDEPDEHYDPSGSQFVRGACVFTGTYWIRLKDFPEGEQVQVRMARIKDGKTIKTHPITEVHGTSGDGFAAIPITHELEEGEGMRMQVYHWQDKPVQYKAYVTALVWPR